MRYSRHTMLPQIGSEGQKRLGRSSALIIGLGGLGSPVATCLAAAGVGHIGLCDADVVSLSNLQRQTLYSEAQIGTPKVIAARDRLQAINSTIKFSIHPNGLNTGNATELIGAYDIILDCTDNFATRFLIDDTCAALSKPWVHASIGEFHGQVTVFGHTLHRRYSELYPDRQQLLALQNHTTGVLGTVPATIGSIQASEALKILGGFGTPLEGELLIIDFLTLHTNLLQF